MLGEGYVHVSRLCVRARLHGARLYCADHWCLLSLTERETTDPFVNVLPRRKEHRERINMKRKEKL